MIAVIPAFEPDGRLVELIQRLDRPAVVVDDGSGPAYAHIFEQVLLLGAHVLTHSRNRGKGCALKTGFSFVRRHFPGNGVVCADSDGQHRPEDITAVADRVRATDAPMVLGARRFIGSVPARSRFGNALTRKVFQLATGRDLIDTQTGLRGYPARMLGWLCRVGGERFEYELRLLLEAVREGMHIEEVEIATIYLDRNASSHFHPLRDSIRIYGPLLAFGASSLLGFTIDAVLLFALTTLTGDVVASAIGARLVSATANYAVNRRLVFRGSRSSPWRYAALAVFVLCANVVLLRWFAAALGSLVLAKALTELVLFLASYLVQRNLVFRHW